MARTVSVISSRSNCLLYIAWRLANSRGKQQSVLLRYDDKLGYFHSLLFSKARLGPYSYGLYSYGLYSYGPDTSTASCSSRLGSVPHSELCTLKTKLKKINICRSIIHSKSDGVHNPTVSTGTYELWLSEVHAEGVIYAVAANTAASPCGLPSRLSSSCPPLRITVIVMAYKVMAYKVMASRPHARHSGSPS